MSADHNNIISHVFLGTGGARPEIIALRCDGLALAHRTAFPAGHSVYAIDVDVESNRIVAGTRAERIDLFSWPSTMEDPSTALLQSLEQGAPVLSVCWAGNSRIASTDTAGRCLLWDPLVSPNTPASLDARGQCVCALLRLPNGQLLGLSCEGTLLFWDTKSGQLCKLIEGPAPPRTSALVRMVYWPAQNAIAYPSADGALVLCKLDPPDLQFCEAYKEAFYVILASHDHLLTLGDGWIKIWDDKMAAPVQQYRAPRGIVSGEILLADPERYLLVDENGGAALCGIEGDELRVLEVLDGHEYRTVIAPPLRVRSAFAQEQKLAEARRIGAKIRENIASGRPEDSEPLHRKLIEMGFESVSLVLQAHEAKEKEDFLAELTARHQLSKRLLDNGTGSRTSLYRYAALLEKAWRLAEACRVYSQIGAVHEGDERGRWLKASRKAMEGQDWVVDPGFPCSDLIDSATVVGEPFAGRWVLDRFEAISFRQNALTAMDFTTKYEQIRAEDGRSGLPKAVNKKLRWISRQMPRNVDTVLLDASREKTTEGLQLSIQFLNDGLQTILLPAILFHAGKPQKTVSSECHNEAARRACQRLGLQEWVGPWLREMHRMVNLTLRRLRSEAIGCGRMGGTNHD